MKREGYEDLLLYHECRIVTRYEVLNDIGYMYEDTVSSNNIGVMYDVYSDLDGNYVCVKKGE